MKATLTSKEFNEFCSRADILELKGYDLSFTVDKQENGTFLIEIIGEHDLETLDTLTEQGTS